MKTKRDQTWYGTRLKDSEVRTRRLGTPGAEHTRRREAEAKEVLKRLFKEGLSVEQVATGVGVTQRTVYRWTMPGIAPMPMALEALRRFVARHREQAEAQAQ